MLESRENFEGIKSRTEEISTDELETIAVMALIEIAEAITELLKLTKETGEPYQEEGR